MHKNSEFKLNKNKLFYKLKHHKIIQSVLIDTLLTRLNCSIENLAYILHVDQEKLMQVWQGNGGLSENEAMNLVCLFYEF